MIVLVLLSSGNEDCETHYLFEQTHIDETEPWRKLGGFTNICREKICEPGRCDPHEPYGGGTTDSFRVYPTNEETARDRYMFFEETDDFHNVWKTHFDPDRIYRAGGRYFYWEGLGDSGSYLPFDRIGKVGHVRRYRRGACSAGDSIGDLKDEVAQKIAEKIESSWAIRRADKKKKLINVYLGSEDCSWIGGKNFDFVNLRYHFYVKPWAPGGWSFYPSFYWRFVSRTRSRYLDCPDADYCNNNQEYIECDNHEYCSSIIPGARCNHIRGYCEKKHSLDVADYGLHLDYTRKCGPLNPFCKEYFKEFKKAFSKLQKNLYRDFFAPLLAEIYERTWAPNENFSCDLDCEEWGEMNNLEGRCVESNVGEDYCEFRPFYVYDVNMYPNEIEFVLVPKSDRLEYPQYTALDLGDLCDEIDVPSWSIIRDDWVE